MAPNDLAEILLGCKYYSIEVDFTLVSTDALFINCSMDYACSLYPHLHFSGHGETLIFDIVKNEWSVTITSPPSSITTNKVCL
jgi:hypothetical protein